MTDAGLLLTIALASCVVVPWLICRSFPPVENTSRAIRRNRDERGPDKLSNRDRRPVSDLLHAERN